MYKKRHVIKPAVQYEKKSFGTPQQRRQHNQAKLLIFSNAFSIFKENIEKLENHFTEST